MEVAHNHNLRLLFSIYPPLILKYPSPPHRLSLKSLYLNQKSVKKRIRNLAGRWSFHLNQMLKTGDSSRDCLVHVVKEGESLSSISKQYGISIYRIAAINRDIVDLDVVYEGQRLRIPVTHGCNQRTETSRLFNFNLDPQQVHKRAFNIINGISLQQKNFIVLIPQRLPHATPTGYFLVLVPLIAFCIRCVIGILFAKIISRHEPNQHHHRSSRGTRWKSALIEPDNVDAESASDLSNSADNDQSEVSFEDVSGGYMKLEVDYQKFLSECGIADHGYWRGGSPK